MAVHYEKGTGEKIDITNRKLGRSDWLGGKRTDDKNSMVELQQGHLCVCGAHVCMYAHMYIVYMYLYFEKFENIIG